MWHTGDDIAIVSFKSKSNTIGEDVLDGMLAAIAEAERNWRGLVIWQTREPFSFGANLASFGAAVQAGRWDVVEAVVAKFQHTSQRLKYSLIPTVAAVRGMALGGSCEFIMHCDRAVAALESYIGLVEAGVGLLPGGGGCKELAVRAAQEVARGANGSQIDPLPFVRTYFQQVAMATVSRSALEAKELGYLRPADVVIFNAYELLWVAKAQVRALSEGAYRPPLPQRNIPVVGKTGIATLEMMLVNMRDGGFISAYDFVVGLAIARVHLRRRRRERQPGRREMAARTRAPGIHDAAEESEDARADRAYVEDRQAAAELRGGIMTRQLQEAYIVAATRTPVGKAPRGAFRHTRPDSMLAHVLKSVLAQVPQIEPGRVEDVIVGCAMPEYEQGMNVARIGLLLAGLPNSVAGMTVNRFCSSGLNAVSIAADRIRTGEADIMIAAGTESMSMIPMLGRLAINAEVFTRDENLGIAYGMGLTAEKVATAWKVSREEQDAFALASHQKALAAQAGGEFTAEISPYPIANDLPDVASGKIVANRRNFDRDEGPRADTSAEGLAKLRPVFAAKGSVTAGNSSQMSDGAGASILVSERVLKELGLAPLARWVGYAVAGVAPEVMGVGPIAAIPKVLKRTGMTLQQIEWIELNEAFAAQSLAVMKELGIDPAKVNPLGGRHRARTSRSARPAPYAPRRSCMGSGAESRSTAW